jgi:hypothetical protein
MGNHRISSVIYACECIQIRKAMDSLLGLGRHCRIGDKQPLFVFRFFSVTNILDVSL